MKGAELTIPFSQGDVLSAITAASRDPAIDAGKLKQLLDMAERMGKFEAEREFSNAMRLCQEQMAPIARDTENRHTGTYYAKLESIDAEIRPVYTSHGFVMSFSSAPPRKEHSVRVTCDVRHSAGHTVQYELEGELDTAGPKGSVNKSGIQGLGSAVTHLKRYLTLMIWNLTLTDPSLWVSAEHARNIREMLDRAGVTGDRMAGFLKFAQAESVEKISPQRYNEVMKMLTRAAELNRRNLHTDKMHPGGSVPA